MNRKTITTVLFTMLFVLSSTFLTGGTAKAAVVFDGDGTADSPYLIKTLEDFREIPSGTTAHFRLENDLDYNNLKLSPNGAFNGVLDGNGHTIKNIEIISTESQVGLFSSFNSASIKNLTLDNINVTNPAGGNNAGILSAYMYLTTISNVNIMNSSVSSVQNLGIGGFVGRSSNSVIQDCSILNSNATGRGFVGGFIGDGSKDRVIRSYASGGTVRAISLEAGGIIGRASGNGSYVIESFAKNTVAAKEKAGGLIGFVYSYDVAYIQNSYSMSTISSTSSHAGGLLGGLNEGSKATITNSYAVSMLSGTARLAIGPGGAYCVNTYFDQDVIGISAPAAMARTTEAMHMKLNYSNWNFDDTWDMDGSYPFLRFESDLIPGEPGDNDNAPVEGVTLEPSRTELFVGDTLQLEALFTPSNARNKNVTWHSSDRLILTVDGNGLVTAAAPGFASVAVMTEEGNFLGFSNILVKEIPVIPVTGVSLSEDNIKLTEGDTYTLSAAITPKDATNQQFTWESSDLSVAEIDSNGQITAVSKGKAVITVTTADGGFTSSCSIKVVNPTKNLAAQDTVTATSNSESSSTYRALKAIDGDTSTRWLARSNTSDVYLEINFGKAETFNHVKLSEFGERIDEYSIQYWDGVVWKDIVNGNRIGEEFTADFEEITSGKIRLLIISTLTSYGPSIYEFEVYNQ